MNCEEIQSMLRTSRSWNRHADESISSDVVEHLSTCAACLLIQKEEDRFDKEVHQAIHEVAIPIELENSLLWKLRQARRQPAPTVADADDDRGRRPCGRTGLTEAGAARQRGDEGRDSAIRRRDRVGQRPCRRRRR